MLAAGELPSVRLGRAVRVPMDALRRWIDERAQRGGRAA
jgi:excisionase family DNA binding protein